MGCKLYGKKHSIDIQKDINDISYDVDNLKSYFY